MSGNFLLRPLFFALVLAASIPIARVTAQNPTTAARTLSLSPSAGDLTTVHRAHAANLPPNVPVNTVLFAPDGSETALATRSSPDGSIDQVLSPPSAGWQIGLYRFVVGLGDASSVSQTFVAGDGQPHVWVDPALPSPNSAINIVGIGLTPNQSINLVLLLTGGEAGQRDLTTKTDANGSFTLYYWPQQAGFPFFAAGNYRLNVPDLQMSLPFTVREHPVSSSLSVADPVTRGLDAGVHFLNYGRNRYLWVVGQTKDGRPAGEFLVGPTDIRGELYGGLPMHFVSAGTYLLATPYDWGEASFEMQDQTPPITPTAIATHRRAG